MRRREVFGIIGLTPCVARFASVAAQPIPRAVRLAYLAPIRIPHLVEALTGGLRDLGYVEGQNLSIEYRFAGEEPERFDTLAHELVRLAPHVIVTVATPATLAAGRATSSIPIVVATAGDLVRSGAVQPRETGRQRDRRDALLGRVEQKATGSSQGGDPDRQKSRCPRQREQPL